MPRKHESLNTKLLRGITSAKSRLYEQAARDGRALVFEENGKIVKRVPAMPASLGKKRNA